MKAFALGPYLKTKLISDFLVGDYYTSTPAEKKAAPKTAYAARKKNYGTDPGASSDDLT